MPEQPGLLVSGLMCQSVLFFLSLVRLMRGGGAYCGLALQAHLQAIQARGFEATPPIAPSIQQASRSRNRHRGHTQSDTQTFPQRQDVARRAPGVFLGGEAEEDPARPNRTMHGRPPTLGRQLSSADKAFPHKVRRALESGMLEYIPLDLLMDDACRHAAREPPMPESAFVISNGKLRLPNASFDVSKESKLSFDEWVGAGANLVVAMHKHLCADGDRGAGGPIALKIADLFEGHFKYLKNLPDARVQFDIVFDYDRRL